jgi:hypothetical protein
MNQKLSIITHCHSSGGCRQLINGILINGILSASEKKAATEALIES